MRLGFIGGNERVRYGTARRINRACEYPLSDEGQHKGILARGDNETPPVLCLLALKHSLRDDAPAVVSMRPQRIQILNRGGINGQDRQNNHRWTYGCGTCVSGGSRERQGQGESRLHRSANRRRLG